MYSFRNDYSEGAHPKVLQALADTNLRQTVGYGMDPCCQAAADTIRRLCAAPDAAVHFLVGGTQVNLVTIDAFLQSYEAVVAAQTGHVSTHETGAIEATGHKVCTVESPDGKLTPALVESVLAGHNGTEHMVLPRIVYISDTTEIGTVYTRAELAALRQCCDVHGLFLYLDGARLGSALASPASDLTLPDLAELTDAFYIGGTKNGALMGEALVIANPALQPDFFRIKKRLGAVLAKGWLLGVQFEALLQDGLYFEMARHANAMAARLQTGLKALGWTLMVDSPTNQIFPVIPNTRKSALDQLCAYEDWCPGPTPDTTVIRFVTCFATTAEDVDGFLAAAAKF